MPPSAETAILRRERLFTLLTQGLSHRLITVIAPAGYGKTTLLADWARSHPNLAVAWCRLDRHDRDPVVLVDHLRAALRSLFPALARVSSSPTPDAALIPSSGRVRTPDSDVMRLCADLEATIVEDLILVLDDVHQADTPAAQRTLELFLDNTPPNVHVCPLSRSQPDLSLPRRRAQQQLFEITPSELAFTPAEIEALFRQVYQLPLDQPTLSKLVECSQGWAAGLVLLRDTLRKVPSQERAIFLDRLALTAGLYDYLADEVWRQQSPNVQRFLLATAILDPVTPQAAAAITGQRAPLRILRHLERSELFVTCDNPQAGVYRYHPLLRNFLQQRLRVEAGKQALADLHTRAAAFFHSLGDWETAISHALDGQDWKSAADWVETHAEETLRRGRLTTLIGWLNRLPPEVLSAHPWLILWRGRAQFLLGEVAAGESDATQSLSLFQTRADWRGVTTARLALAAIRFRRGDYAGAMEECQSVLVREDPATAPARAEANDWLACCLLESGNPQAAEEAFSRALSMYQAQGDLTGQAVAYHHLASVALVRGDLGTAERQSQQALDLFRRLGQSQAAQPLLRLTEIYHLHGEENLAVDIGNEALRLAEMSNWPLARAYALTYRADALTALGQADRAEEDYRQALSIGELLDEPAMRILPLLGLSRLRLEKSRTLSPMFPGSGGDSRIAPTPQTIAVDERTQPHLDLDLVAELERRERTTGDPALRAAVMTHIGDVCEARGDPSGALQHWREAEALWQQLGTDHEIVRLKLRQANLALTAEDSTWVEAMRQALRLSAERGYDFLFARAERRRALPLLVAVLITDVEAKHAGALLIRFGSEAVAPLLAVLFSPDPGVRMRVAQVLGDIGDQRAARPLRRLQRDPHPPVRQTALAALRRIALNPPPPLRLLTLGDLTVLRGEEQIAAHAWGRKAARRLLKILIAKRGQIVPREVLIDLLWPEVNPVRGMKRLKALVHHLRRILEPDLSGEEPSSYILLEGDGYTFRLQPPASLDAEEFVTRVRQAERLAYQGLSNEALREYEAADALYRGDYMQEDLYEDWCALERESLRETHLRVLEALADAYLARNQYERAADCCRRSLDADPLREGAQRGLMIALARSGRRAEALRQYQTCCQVLLREIGVEPMPETQALYQRLLRQEAV